MSARHTSDRRSHARQRRARAALTALALAIAVSLSTVALGSTFSYYRTGTLESATTYVSVQRSDWNGTAVHNQSTTWMNASTWAYNVITNQYVLYKEPASFAPNSVYGGPYGSQTSTRNYCRKHNGGTQNGACYGWYG